MAIVGKVAIARKVAIVADCLDKERWQERTGGSVAQRWQVARLKEGGNRRRMPRKGKVASTDGWP